MRRECISHVSSVEPSHSPKHFRIEPQIQIRRGLGQNFQGLTTSAPKVVQFPLWFGILFQIMPTGESEISILIYAVISGKYRTVKPDFH